MSYRTEWTAAKKAMDTAKIDTKKLFKEELGPALDAYEAALATLDKIPGTEPDKEVAARKKMMEAAKKAQGIIGSYLKSLKFFESGLDKAPAQKAVVEKAITVLSMHIYGEIRKETTGQG